ncbi:Sushi domain-containing protein 1 [Merluccius polli]|uniref:Sushi domain-containing protein 1 n=1 Tax=Merluccius polli TaxID=89951 RepID=A0AA47M8B0_MERPO|nr:Sushi domain-containing protein 1 [Merluccius polli]
MDRRHGPVILIVLLSVITDMPAAGQLEDICASCHLNAVCIDKVEGSGKMCICMHGFSGNGREYCQDKDECLIGIKICGLHTSCHNTFGSYYCTCRPGFSPSNHQTAFIPNDGTYCQDVDECQRIPGVCGAGAGCENLEGDFECRCLLGYRVHNAAEPFHPLRDKGSCKVVDCGPSPPTVAGTVVLSTTGTTYGNKVLLGCQDGFVLRRGDTSSTCGGDGSWSRPGLVCEEVDCGSPPTPPHSHMVRWDKMSRLGSAVLYHCNSGYQNVGRDTVSVCTASGQWEVSMLCEAVNCGGPPDPPHAFVLWGNGSTLGSWVVYQCKPGYHNMGEGNGSVCSASGEWSPARFLCQAGCGSAPWLAQAVVVRYNTSVTVHRCMDGYHSWRGSNVSVCGSTGKWQKATLKCVEVKPAINDLHVFNEKCLRWRAEKYEHDQEYYKLCSPTLPHSLLSLTRARNTPLYTTGRAFTSTVVLLSPTQVVYRGTREYQGYFHHERKQLLISGAEWVDLCLGLLPATNYTVSITALSTRFTASITTNTSLQVPQAPSILYTELDTLTPTLRLQRFSSHFRRHQVFVVPLDRTVVFDCKSRGSPDFSVVGPLSGPYITGQFPVRHMSSTQMNFTLGDGCYHGGFFNAPLKRGINYYVILRVVSHWKEVW